MAEAPESDYEATTERLGLDADDPAVKADIQRVAGGPVPSPQTEMADPGWYQCQGRQRWWDGAAWTDRWGPEPAKKGWSKSAELGMWLALFIPPAGFFVGLALIAGKDKHAHWVVSTSIVVPIVVVLLLAGR